MCKYAIGNRPLVATISATVDDFFCPPRPKLSLRRRASSSSYSHRPRPPIPVADSIPFPRLRRVINIIIRPLVSVVVIGMALSFPDFTRVMSLLGSASAFLICCIGQSTSLLSHGVLIVDSPRFPPLAGPILAYLVLAGNEVERARTRLTQHGELKVGGLERTICWILFVISIFMACVGTVWSFLPLE